MIYLILSSAFIDKNDISKGYEPILKIGYTGESSRKSRFDIYITENPTINVLYLIEGGTEIDELKLHNHFNHLKKNYGRSREWFRYDQEIIDFFESHKTKESLKEIEINYPEHKLNELRKKVLSNRKNISKLNYITSNIIEKYFPDSRKDIVECNKIYNNLLNDLIINFHQLTDYLSENYPEVDDIGEIDVPEEINTILDRFFSFKSSSDKLRYLCSLSESTIKTCLPHLPDEYINYINVIGIGRIRANGYNISDVRKEYKEAIGNKDIDIKSAILTEFKVGDRLPKSEVKDRLKNLYLREGYSKTARAIDLGDYFIIKNCKIPKPDGGRDNGYEIISIKDETINES